MLISENNLAFFASAFDPFLALDADTFALKNIYLKDFQKVFPENYNKCDMISFYDEEKEDLHYLEGFNLNSQTAIELLGDLRGAYISV